MDQDYVIYLDLVFGINFIMDYGILWAAAKLGQFKTSPKRLGTAALFGAAYSLAVFLPEVHWLFFYGIKFLFSVVMVYLAFVLPSWRKVVQAVGFFYMVAFSAAGAMLGAIYFFDNTPGAYAVMNGALVTINSVNGAWLLLAIGALGLVGRYGTSYLKKGLLGAYTNIPIVIRFKNHSVPVKALIDTGNQLKDPLTHKPVMIVEYRVIKDMLPPVLQNVFERGEEPDLGYLLEHMEDNWWPERMRLIPFQSIGKSSGLMLAFRPDIVFLRMGEKLLKVQDVVVGICNKTLSQSGTYRALLHIEMLNQAL